MTHEERVALILAPITINTYTSVYPWAGRLITDSDKVKEQAAKARKGEYD